MLGPSLRMRKKLEYPPPPPPPLGPNHTFFHGKLERAVNQYFAYILSLVIDNKNSKCLEARAYVQEIPQSQNADEHMGPPIPMLS